MQIFRKILKTLGANVISTPEEAGKYISELKHLLKRGNEAEVQKHVKAIISAGEMSVEPLLRHLISGEGATRFWADMDFTKSRNRGWPYRPSVSFSFTPENVRYFEMLADIMVRIGKPVLDELISIVRGKWVAQNVGLTRGQARFSPKKHEGIMIALEKAAPLIKHDLEQILVNGHDFSQEAAVYTLRFIPDAAVVKLLLDTAVATKFLDVNFVCERSLAFIATTELDLVTAHLASPDADIRRYAINSLVYSDHTELIPAFIGHYPKETDECNCLTVLKYFYLKKDSRTMPLLQSVAAGSIKWLADAAKDALDNLAKAPPKPEATEDRNWYK